MASVVEKGPPAVPQERASSPAANGRAPRRLILLAVFWALPFLVAFLPIVLLSVYALRIAEGSLKDVVNLTNISATTNFSQQLSADTKKIFDIANAMSSLPGTLEAVERLDAPAMRERLKLVVLSSPELYRAFVTTTGGVLWSDFPIDIEAIGEDFSSAEWYRAMAERWKPIVSATYFKEKEGAPPRLIAAIATPINDAIGRPKGIFAIEYSLNQLSKRLQNIRLGESGFLFLLDQNAILIAHPTAPPDSIRSRTFASIPPVQAALHGTFQTSEYIDPLKRQRMLATFMPFAMGNVTWVIVAAQPYAEAYAPLRAVQRRIAFAGGFLTILTLFMVIALARAHARNQRLNSELHDKNLQLLQAAAMKDNVISFVSHQLRAPVTAIRWNADLLVEEMEAAKCSEEMLGLIHEIQTVNMQNLRMILDLLNASRIERGVIEVSLAPVQLKDVVEAAVRNYRKPIGDAGLSLNMEGIEQDIVVLADSDKMAEAVGNSVSNAIKHTVNGSITVRMRAEGENGIVDVIDTGKGMPPEMLEKLFTRDQILGSNVSAEGSAGIGLFIAKNFMTLQHGSISVASGVGTGTTFTYSIPLAKQTPQRNGE